MRKSYFIPIAFAVAFLFFIQMAGTLVESIYILNLLNTALDGRALGLSFFFSPILLLFLPRKAPSWFTWVVFGLLFLARGMTPYLDTTGRLWASGLGTGAALLLIPILLTAAPKGLLPFSSGFGISAGLALGVGISVLLRTIHFTIDYSLSAEGSWAGWSLGLLLGIALGQLEWSRLKPSGRLNRGRVASASFGLILVLTLVYFVFSAPAVLARWTAGNYPLIVSITILAALGWVLLAISPPGWLKQLSPRVLLAWNGLFTLSLLVTILVHRVPFPQTPESAPVIIGAPTLIQQIPTFITLLLYPVIFLDLRFFTAAIQAAVPDPKDLAPGMTLGSLGLILLVFMMIFTNVWGYIEPVSSLFRNKFWLPFALITGLLTVLSTTHARKNSAAFPQDAAEHKTGWTLVLLGFFLLTVGFALGTTRITSAADSEVDTLLVMTYNIQAANDQAGEKAYERQLELIQQISPDIVAFQESDTARISLNNNDFVRFFAGKLGYYSYYGPTTVTGTFGTAILSRFPLQNPRTIFSYSDQDEIGTAVATMEAGGQTFTIYNVHPDGSDTAMLAFVRTLLADATGKEKVIALGDYNLREDEAAYQMIDAEFTNAWTSFFPSGVSATGVDMSGKKRIDHIFLSPDLQAGDPVYLLPPESHTDHPTHWSRVFWEE